MPTLQFVTGALDNPSDALTGRVSCVITSTAGTVRLPQTDPAVDYNDSGMVQWTEIPVSGGEPLLGVAGMSRAKVNLKGMLYAYRGVTAVEQKAMLDRIAASEHAVTVAWGTTLSAATWVITGYQVTGERLFPGSNDLMHANWSLTLTRYAKRAVKVASTKKSTHPRKRPRRIPIRKGETLAQFAARVTGDASTMSLIAKDNGIRNPRRVKPGFVFTVNY